MYSTKYLVLFLAVSLTSMVAACGNKYDASSMGQGFGTDHRSDQGVITLSLQTLQSEKSSPAYIIEEKIVNDYMQIHPNIKIEFDRLNTEQQKNKLKAQAASGEVADITMVNPGAQMKPFVDSGVLAPLDDVLDGELKATFQSGVLSYYTFDGKVYALPYNLNIAGIFYNKEIFVKAGLSFPKTFEDLIEVSKQLRAKGVTPIAIGAKDRWTTSFLFMNILQRLNGGPGFLQDVITNKRNFNDPVFVHSVQKLQNLIQAGAFDEGVTSIDSNTASNLFRSGRAAMYYIGTWEVPKIETWPDKEKVGFMKFPTVEGKGDPNDFMIAPGTAYTLSAKSKNLQESKQFLKYLMMNYPTVAFKMNAAVGLSQKVKGDFKAASYSQLQIETLNMFKDIKGGEMNFDNVIIPAVAQTHLDQLQNLFVQHVKAEEVAKEHQISWELNTKRK
ncbi:raffinose/stachyose/melibiose transport system substrate-binding protein [Paenibacillus sp. 1_12]|uniref:extracellular solute-binding protein n=1 Tax=Paenibacillus sp. 1_12 TaxID=1566278 RepID=UPI0008E1ABA1|nr:extracellular solute-binding protein [Paenibacillus sp. 1_12]SFL64494.1 raffinose/stachyose/melibiose transport system substrate-binding protein [Paenibacillus sp. 1_12]